MHDPMVRACLNDPDWAAFTFMEIHMAVRNIRRAAEAKVNTAAFSLPEDRHEPVQDPDSYAYLITGEKKIGKTTFAIEDCEELVLQFDKPQIAYNIREIAIKSWPQFMQALKALEEKVKGKFPYTRVVIDGAGEWYTMCHANACKHFAVEHPSEEGYARCWHKIRDDFTDAVNRLMRLQRDAGCGLMFIAHGEWKEKQTRGGAKVEKLVLNLPPKCEEILNGKCDAWFPMDYDGKHRVMILQGDEVTGAGHRIDGHFMTTDGRRVCEVHMGSSAKQARENFLAAFNNKQEYATLKEGIERGLIGGTQTTKKIVRRK